MKKLSLRHFIVIILIWTLIGILGTTKATIMNNYRGYDSSWIQISYFHLSSAWIWAIFTPFLITLTRRLKFESRQILKPIALYFLIGLIIAPLHRFLAISSDFTVKRLLGTLEIPVIQLLDQIKLVIISTSFDSFLTYWIIIGLFLGIDYYLAYREKQINNAKLEVELANAQLSNLKAQLHPHFLFNSIQAISTLMHRDIELADKALSRLSFLLRKSFENFKTSKISLREEMEFINHYIALQKARFQDKVEVRIQIPDEYLDYLVPPLILQPLVENAFKHAIETSRSKECLSIIAELNNGLMTLQINNSKGNKGKSNGDGIGLKNTRERLENLYGNNSQLLIENEASTVFKVKIKLPAEKLTFYE